MPKSRKGRIGAAASAAASPISPAASSRASRYANRQSLDNARAEEPEVKQTPKKEQTKSAKKPASKEPSPKPVEVPQTNNVEATKEGDAEGDASASGSDEATTEKEGDGEDDEEDKEKKSEKIRAAAADITNGDSAKVTEEVQTIEDESEETVDKPVEEAAKKSEKESDVELIEEEKDKNDDVEIIEEPEKMEVETSKKDKAADKIPNEKSSKNLAIVTGASSGIGAAVCRSLVEAGMVVAGLARRVDKIKELAADLANAPGSLQAYECDLTQETQICDVFKRITSQYGPPSITINNAGYSTNASLLDGNVEDWRSMLDVNIVALCLLTKLSVKSMTEHKMAGHIIHVSSMSGHRVVASSIRTNFYSATKHAVRALTEGLRNELRALQSPIRISSVSPGLVETGFAEAMAGAEEAKKLYSSLKSLTSKDVADTIMHLINAPPHVEITDVLMRPTEQKT